MSIKTILLLLIFLPLNIFSQELHLKQKSKIKKELRNMVKADQYYRQLILKNNAHEDSLWILQSINDSINKEKFKDLIHSYGYPSLDRIGNQYSVLLILHFTNELDFNELQPLFREELAKKNMPPTEYAMWFDRCQINMKKPNTYGVYGKKEFCGAELNTVNSKRAEIGLEELKPAPDCK